MDIFLRIALLFLTLIIHLVNIIQSFISKEVKKSVPLSEDPILKQSATVLAQKIRERKIFSQEVVESYIKRIKEVNPIINAVIEDRFEDALQEAKDIDQYLDENRDKIEELKISKPFFGVPITVKEAIALKGLSHTGCSNARRNIKADDDSVVVKYMKNSGVIPLLVSSTPEYCTSVESYNKIIGYTYNPYNTLYTSGGSSGGEGALLGAGASVIGIGSDIGGSVRLPALFNGIFGHKPTAKIVSLEGHWPNDNNKNFQTMLVIGPMARYVEDLKPMLKVMAGPNVTKLKLDEKVDLSKIQIFYMEDCGNDFFLPTVEKEMKTAIKTAAAYLSKECHCHINNHKFKELGDILEMSSATLISFNKVPTALNYSKTEHNLILEIFKALFGKSKFTMQHLLFMLFAKINEYVFFQCDKYLQKKEEVQQILEDALGDNGVLIYPSMPYGVFKFGQYLLSLPGASYLTLPNLMGFPATAVPTGFNSNSMPTGIQIIAGPNQDRLTLAIAQELEKCFGGWQPVP